MSSEELLHQIKAAATSLLTDDEICIALGITKEKLNKHYTVVETARVNLKQQLNAKRITQAAHTGDAEELVAQIPRNKISSRGGARPGSGRKPGTTNKISATQILDSIEAETGQQFGTLLAQGYAESIQSNDRATRIKYEQMFLNKVVAERVEIDLNETESSVERKQQAFQEAMAKLADLNESTK
jgi:hypothetical protein